MSRRDITLMRETRTGASRAGSRAVSVITPPAVTGRVVEEAGRRGTRQLWMQPRAEGDAAVRSARELGMNVISGGPCLLVVLGFRE